MQFIFFLLLFFLTSSGATALPVDKTQFYLTQGPDWASFSVYEKALSFKEVQTTCRRWAQNTQTYYGCSRISFVLNTCHFVYLKGMPNARKHELLHCSGYDHQDGQSSEAPLLDGYRALQTHIRQQVHTVISQTPSISVDEAFSWSAKRLHEDAANHLKLEQLPFMHTTPLNGWRRVTVLPYSDSY